MAEDRKQRVAGSHSAARGKSRKRRKTPGIAYQNKDITSKILSEEFMGESLEAYGLSLPRIIRTEPTNLPAIEANELRLDILFRLEDGSAAVIDYESGYDEGNKVKYMSYITRVERRLYREEGEYVRIRMVVIYAADVRRGRTEPVLDLGGMRMELTEAFLSDFDPASLRRELEEEIGDGTEVADRTLMRLIIYPLTHPGLEDKRKAVSEAIGLAEEIRDPRKQAFALTGIYTFTDKVITKEDADRIRRKLSMTQVEQIYTRERIEAVKEATKRVTEEVTAKVTDEVTARVTDEAREEKEASAMALLREGISVEKVARCLKLPLQKAEELYALVHQEQKAGQDTV